MFFGISVKLFPRSKCFTVSLDIITFHFPAQLIHIIWKYVSWRRWCCWCSMAVCVFVCPCMCLPSAMTCSEKCTYLVCSHRDLSKNHISSLDTSLLERLPGLRELWVHSIHVLQSHCTQSISKSQRPSIWLNVTLSFRYLQGNRINVLPRGVFCCSPLSVLWVQSQGGRGPGKATVEKRGEERRGRSRRESKGEGGRWKEKRGRKARFSLDLSRQNSPEWVN